MGKINKILGIDYGEKRVGTAVGFLDSKISLPQEIIENNNVDLVVGEILKIIDEEEIDLVVVGVPVSLSGEKESDQFKITKQFTDLLSRRTNVKIVEEDERLTSREAAGLLSGGKQGKRDDVAAMLILQNYINKNA